MEKVHVTYIGHSGFLIEWESCVWLFDYYKGEIPQTDPGKPLFVFVSHSHRDHFNPAIFRLRDSHYDVRYVLSSDIRLDGENGRKAGVSPGNVGTAISVAPSADVEFSDGKGDAIRLRTLRSTDCGVAFLLRYRGKTVYHAGDLNLWVWKEETEEYNRNMTEAFQKEMAILKDVPIDLAFAPLDPRQEEDYSAGLKTLLETAKVRYVFPMHFWKFPSTSAAFIQEVQGDAVDAKIMDIERNGQRWTLEL